MRPLWGQPTVASSDGGVPGATVNCLPEDSNEPVIQTKPRRKKLGQAFKRQAVELWLGIGRAATEVAAGLGIPAQGLSAWRKRFAPTPSSALCSKPEPPCRRRNLSLPPPSGVLTNGQLP